MTNFNDEAVIRLGIRCIQEFLKEYLSRHSEKGIKGYQNYLRRHLTTDCWLRSVIDAEEIIACMERVRQEKLRNELEYRMKHIE